MKLTIIPADGAVYKDGICYSGLSFTVPDNVHALQWRGEYGWVEFSNGNPNETITELPMWADAAMAVWDEANTPPVPQPPTPEQVLAEYTSAIQSRLDTFAQTRGYDGILSACTYATSSVPKFAAEGQYCVDARDATWASAYEILNDVTAGNRLAPSLDDLFAELPALGWPL